MAVISWESDYGGGNGGKGYLCSGSIFPCFIVCEIFSDDIVG